MGGRLRLVVSVLAACLLAAPAAGAATIPGLTHGRITGRLSGRRVMHVTVTLAPRDPGALTAYARAVATPGSAVYHRYLTPAQFGRRFGASTRSVAAVRRALRARGLPASRLSSGRLSLAVTAPASRLERGLRVALLTVRLPNRRTAVAASMRPRLGVSGVQSILGLGSLAAPRPLLIHGPRRPAHAALAKRPAVVTGGPQPCTAARNAASSQGAYTSDQIASAYGFPGLFGAGDLGAGVTVAVYELEPVAASDLAAYQSCYRTSASIGYVHVDGGVGSGSGSGEAALDVENVLSYAPAARVLVYEGPNSSSGSPGAGPYDTFATIVDQDRAQVVSISWGECEAALGGNNAAAENTLFEQAAIQGQTIVSASGDSGSEDCNGEGAVPQTQLAVDDPASQPFVLGVGGTNLTSLGPRPTESVWNDGGSPFSILQPGAGGGGVSALWPMPPAQGDAASSLGVLGPGASGAPCGNSGGFCREVPDVALSAEPSTGYEIYWNGSGQAAGQPSGWQAFGGTSAAAPVWAALMALTDASRSCHAAPLGYALPALYRAAGAGYAASFNDVVNGNNDFSGTNQGRYGARSGYDEATGLGSPNATTLAGSLCAQTLRLTPMAAKRSARGASVGLRLSYVDAPGAKVTLHVFNLPPGLHFSSRTQRITGRARRTGLFDVGVAAIDAQDGVATEGFPWRVGGAPRLRAATVRHAAGPRPGLSFALDAGKAAPALRRLLITVPPELKLRSTRGVRVTSGRSHVRLRAKLTGRHLDLMLHRAYQHLTVRLSSPGVVAGAARVRRSVRGRRMSVTLFDTGGGTSTVRARVHNA